MRMHPAEIVEELKNFEFFKLFEGRLLLQLATMMENRTFTQGDCILVEGQRNQCLYFLRSGAVELYINGTKIAVLADQGEVMGEMSVITGKPASTTIVAETTVEIFVLDTANFLHVLPIERDLLQLLLHKVYCNILVDRLTRANARKL